MIELDEENKEKPNNQKKKIKKEGGQDVKAEKESTRKRVVRKTSRREIKQDPNIKKGASVSGEMEVIKLNLVEEDLKIETDKKRILENNNKNSNNKLNLSSSNNNLQLDTSKHPKKKSKKQKMEDYGLFADKDELQNTIVMIQDSSKGDQLIQLKICEVCCCFGGSEDEQMLICKDCGDCYHRFCISTSLKHDMHQLKKDWQCNSCKVCEECKSLELEEQLLVCDFCDKCYHTFCCDPPIKGIPEGEWRCNNCNNCSVCKKPCLTEEEKNLLQVIPSRSKKTTIKIEKNENSKFFSDSVFVNCSSCNVRVHLACLGDKKTDPVRGLVCFSCELLFVNDKKENSNQTTLCVSEQQDLHQNKTSHIVDTFLECFVCNKSLQETTKEGRMIPMPLDSNANFSEKFVIFLFYF